MTLKKIDYSKTIIYKIVSKDLSITECYVGSTTNFRGRKSKHKLSCTNSNSKKYSFPLYKFIRDNSGWDNFEMIEIEKYPCRDSNEARSRERYYFELLNASLNKVRPLVTEEEYKNKTKEYKETEKYKEYHKEFNIEYCKKYRDENKDILNAKKREKVTCSCGSIITRGGKSRHEKTFIHISKSQTLFHS
jgi:hypothetical protein